MCPRFSATSTIATGAISTIALASNTGAAKFGRPNHAAAPILAKSIGGPKPMPFAAIVVDDVADDRADQDRDAPREARRVDGAQADRHHGDQRDPAREGAAVRVARTDAGCALIAIGASTSPITATMPPVTTGGISLSIQRWPGRHHDQADHRIDRAGRDDAAERKADVRVRPRRDRRAGRDQHRRR